MERNRKKAQKARFRVVIDTSVLIAALMSSQGYAFEVIEKVLNGQITNYYSRKTLQEYKTVVAYPKIIKKIPVEVAILRVSAVASSSKLISIKKSFQKSKRIKELVKDKKDIPFLDVVYNAKAEFLITYDRKHLLKIRDKTRRFKLNSHEFYILTPKEFIEEFYEANKKKR